MVVAAVYCRISRDRAGAELGVQRQEDDCRALVERLGWQVGAVLVDNDRSAYSGKPRPSYERVLEGLASGAFGAVVAWHPDRLHRSPVELERFIDVVERAGAQVVTCQAGEVDLSTPAGRMTARVVGAVARHESEHKAERLRRKHVELAQAGKVSGGGRRAFGYRNVLEAGRIVRVELVDAEADLVREAARRVLAGESVRAVVMDWRRRGVESVSGAPWSVTTVRRMLQSGRIAGKRTHRGEVIADAVWPAIIDPADSLRLRALLSDPARDRGRGKQPSRYLLSGLVMCGRCGAKMTTRPDAERRRRYLCTKDRNGCGGCGIVAEPVEVLVADTVFVLLDTPAMAAALAPRDDDQDDNHASVIADVEAQLADLAVLWADGGLSVREWSAARDRLLRRRDAAYEALSAAVGRGAVPELVASGEALRAMWPTLGFDQRRAVVAALVERVVIGPVRPGRNRFDAERVDVVWRI